jgi:hypothetical protein
MASKEKAELLFKQAQLSGDQSPIPEYERNPTVSTADSCVDSAWVNIAGGALMRAATSS